MHSKTRRDFLQETGALGASALLSIWRRRHVGLSGQNDAHARGH